MINDPKYINEVLDKLKKVSDEEIVEAIKKVDLEDDIKILEEFKKNGYSMLYIKYGDRNKTNLRLERAIEKLLKRYKELEEENKTLKEITNSYNAFGNDYIPNDMKFIIADREYFYSGIFKESFIPISVIQNKKNEYDKMLKATYGDPTYSGDNRRRECLEALQVLQDLLEERNK